MTELVCRNHPEVSLALGTCSRCGGTFCADCLIQLNHVPVCAACRQDVLLDARSGTSSSELPAIVLAGLWQRLLAAYLDFAVVAALVLPATIHNYNRAHHHHIDHFLAWQSPVLVVGTLYRFLMVLRYGQTLGKMLLRIRVVRIGGAPLSAMNCLIRAVVMTLFVIPDALLAARYVFLIDVLPIFLRRRQCVHDMLAHSIVIKVPRSVGVLRGDTP